MQVLPSCLCSSCPAHGESPMPCPVYPSWCTDEQWMLLEALLPAPGNTGGKGGRGEKHPRRLVLDAIFYLVRGGIAWRALPTDFPPRRRYMTSSADEPKPVYGNRLPTCCVIVSESAQGVGPP